MPKNFQGDFELNTKELKSLFAAKMMSYESVIDKIEHLTDLCKSNPGIFSTSSDSPKGFVGNYRCRSCGRYLLYKNETIWVGACFDNSSGEFKIELFICEHADSLDIATILSSKKLCYKSLYIPAPYFERWYSVSLPDELIFASDAELVSEIQKII